MQPFISYREKNEDGLLCFYILQKAFPHYCGLIVAEYPVEGAIINQPIAGYNLWVSFNFTLRGHFIPAYKDVKDEIENVYSNMADWYLVNRIIPNEKLYKKFKIKINDTVSQR